MVTEKCWVPDNVNKLFFSFSAEFKPKKIKTEEDRSEKKAKKRKPVEEVCLRHWLISIKPS